MKNIFKFKSKDEKQGDELLRKIHHQRKVINHIINSCSINNTYLYVVINEYERYVEYIKDYIEYLEAHEMTEHVRSWRFILNDTYKSLNCYRKFQEWE